MHFLMGFDGSYAMGAAATLQSLATALGDDGATVDLLAGEVGAPARDRVRASVPETIELRWHDLDVDLLATLPLSSLRDEAYITATSYAVLLLDRYLPDDVGRVAYLDADVLVRRSPAELFVGDLQGRTAAAVRDVGCCAIGMPGGPHGWRHLDLDGRLAYLNSGLVVVDRHRWVAEKVEERCFDYLGHHRHHISYLDQDALNATLAGDWVELPLAWNYQAHLEWDLGGDHAEAFAFFDADDIAAARRDPAIVHYTGSRKPWTHDGTTLPFAGEWVEALDRTAWRGGRPSPPAPPAHVPTWRRAAARASRAGNVLRHG